MTLFYRSRRVGKKGKLFTLYKFKTLNEGYNNAFVQENAYKPLGHFLRKTKLDEFPQLINVLKGELTLVGPRPHEPEEVAHYPERFRHIPLAKAGVTGLSQVNGASELPFLKELGYDGYYVAHQGILLDLKILAKTLLIFLFDPTAI